MIDDIDFYNQTLAKENVVIMPLPIHGQLILNRLVEIAEAIVTRWPDSDPALPAIARALREEYQTNFVNVRPFQGSANDYRDRVLAFQHKIINLVYMDRYD